MTTLSERQVFTVSELTRNIRFVLEGNFTSVWVEGEITNFKHHSSGHLYFSLKDAESQVSCVQFRREAASLGFEPEEGLAVVAFGRISVYGPRGQYQLYVERMEPKGLGALQLRFQKMKEKLEREGLFDEARKREIPYLPKTIAVVTSTDGAALRDFLTVVGRRFSSAHVVIVPSSVQGSAAPIEIASAIEEANRLELADVIVLTRGGGSLEDLWAFNEEIVARAIFNSGIPVVSAVGHEVDFTIADFVADMRAPTPSAAAELLVPVREELLARVEELKARALQSALGLVRELKQNLKVLAESGSMKDPLWYFESKCQRLDELKRATGARFAEILRRKKESVASAAARLEALGPLSALRRGFSVTLKGEKVVTDASKLKVGERVVTRLGKGSFVGEVKEIHP